MPKTYQVRLILRPSGRVGSDKEAELIVQVRDESHIRRRCLEHAWKHGWIVGRFCSIEVLETKKET